MISIVGPSVSASLYIDGVMYVDHAESHEHIYLILKQISWVSGCGLLQFHEIHRMIRHFFQCCTSMNNVAAVEVHFSILQPCVHDLLNCFIFVVLAPCVIFKGWNRGNLKMGQVQTVERMGKHFPAKLFTFSQCQMCSVRVCIVVKNDLSFHRALVRKCMSQLLSVWT
jgi:hypothetical protein